MKIIYHHWKDKEKESFDERNNWWTCPPEFILDEAEEKTLIKWWKRFGGMYIEDPLGHTQCNYIIYTELPKWFRMIFFELFISREHVYDIISE